MSCIKYVFSTQGMNTKCHWILIILLCTVLPAYSQEYGRGLIKTDFDTSKLTYREIPNTRSGLPSSYSLQNYAPPVGDQGKFGSCTSWSSAYCAFTIVKRIETGTNIGPFDPINLHNRLKALNSEGPCTDGNYVEQAASLLTSHGCATLTNQTCSYVSAGAKYKDKMPSFENLSISAYDFKYVLSQEKSPIVISADFYTNGWANTANLSYGVWNGLCAGKKDGAHAMVIIGYDDYKAGGAFLVQNSWGTSWGYNGYFWIRYSDLSKIVYAATQFKPSSYSYEDIDVDLDESSSNNQVYRFYNNCSLTTYVTLSKNIGENWITEGWYAISSGGYIDLPISDRSSNQLYWMATANNNGTYIDWTDNVNGRRMCFDRVYAHKIYDNSSYNCPNVANFHETIPDSRVNMEVTTLTCPNVVTRGGEVVFNTAQLFSDILPGDEYSWDGKSAVIDAYSTRIIQPTGHEEGKEDSYDLYFIEGKKVAHFTGNASQLMTLKALKFATEMNAKSYLNTLQDKN